ncbi:MAG: hypothetical protein WC099_01070 [Candidatus Paceibacterota bacterium]
MHKILNHTKVIFVIVGVFLLCGIALIMYSSSPTNSHQDTSLITPIASSTTPSVSSIPQPSFQPFTEQHPDSYTLSKPDQLIPAPIKTNDTRKTKLFYLQETIDGFTPDHIVIERTDRVRIQFTAVDDAYDLAIAPPIGAYIAAAHGGSTLFGFDAHYITPGIYTFVCQKSCPPRYAQGTLVIK